MIIFNLIFLVIAFVITFTLLPIAINFLKKLKFGQNIREEWMIGKASMFFDLHKSKAWTPTMWWSVFLFVVAILVFWSFIIQWLSPYFWITFNNNMISREETYLVLFTFFTVWILGMVDDYMNIKWIWKQKWLSGRFKMIWILLFSLLWAYWFYFKLWFSSISIPFYWDLSVWLLYIPIFIFIIAAMSNAVNITDWLDWLAWGLLLFNYAVFAYISYEKSLMILSAFCLIIVWILIAYLWFNIKPAKIMMWDSWSLPLGATLWVIAMMTDTLAVLAIIALVYTLEILSVIIQLTSKKLRWGKKVFKIAPYHHHLEACGWKEETIVMRFWLIWMVLSSIWLVVNAFLI